MPTRRSSLRARLLGALAVTGLVGGGVLLTAGPAMAAGTLTTQGPQPHLSGTGAARQLSIHDDAYESAGTGGSVDYTITDYTSCAAPSVTHHVVSIPDGFSLSPIDFTVPVPGEGFVKVQATPTDANGVSTSESPTAIADHPNDVAQVDAQFTSSGIGKGTIHVTADNGYFLHDVFLEVNGQITQNGLQVLGCGTLDIPFTGIAPGATLSLYLNDVGTAKLIKSYVVPTPPAALYWKGDVTVSAPGVLEVAGDLTENDGTTPGTMTYTFTAHPDCTHAPTSTGSVTTQPNTPTTHVDRLVMIDTTGYIEGTIATPDGSVSVELDVHHAGPSDVDVAVHPDAADPGAGAFHIVTDNLVSQSTVEIWVNGTQTSGHNYAFCTTTDEAFSGLQPGQTAQAILGDGSHTVLASYTRTGGATAGGGTGSIASTPTREVAPDPASELAETGPADATGELAIGLGLLAAGLVTGAVVLIRRRRRTQ